MRDKVVPMVNFKEKKGSQNIEISPNSDPQAVKKMEKMLETLTLLRSFPVNNELSVSLSDGGDEMERHDYITEKELKALEDRLEQKIEFNQQLVASSIESLKNETNLKIDSLGNEISLKFENQYLQLENLISKKFNSHTKWLIGTVIAVAGVLFTLLQIF